MDSWACAFNTEHARETSARNKQETPVTQFSRPNDNHKVPIKWYSELLHQAQDPTDPPQLDGQRPRNFGHIERAP